MCASLQLKQGNNRLEMVNKTESILQAIINFSFAIYEVI